MYPVNVDFTISVCMVQSAKGTRKNNTFFF